MSGMAAALALFIALHSIPAIPSLKARIIATIGRSPYLIAYSIVSTGVLIWLFYEALKTDYVELWSIAAWQVHLTFVAAPLGLFLVIAGLFSANPFSVTLRRDGSGKGAIVGVTRHPVLWGFFFWAAGHIPPNGDLRSLILFGGFGCFSLGGVLMAERRSRRKFGAAWKEMIANTSVLPMLAIATRPRSFRIDAIMLISAAATVAATIWLLHGGHAWLVGADPLATLSAL
ncbi:NnrU family protein [Rhizobium sp. LjRoot30]|uniref:NnrU family protein n=1 Tax=Rhizobium sp. LjRoot30 TaxID=3342320 RepID=UPI003ED0F6FB